MSVNYEILPHHLREEAKAYIEYGILPSGFLGICIVGGDWNGGTERFDPTHKDTIADNVQFWSTEAPAKCFGSEQAVTNWIGVGGKQGIAEARMHEKEAMEVAS